MENKKKIELIKLSTIGCISEDDQASLNSLLIEDENFPWEELGEFQNLVALLPSALLIETPNWELKDKVARKLYKLRDEIKSQKEEKKPVEKTAETSEQLSDKSEEGIIIDDNDKDIKEYDLAQVPSREKSTAEPVVEEKPEQAESISKSIVNKELIEKTTKEFVSSHIANEIGAIQKNTKKSLLLSLVLFIVVLLLIAFMYFKFSGDLDSKQEEIDILKKRLGITYIEGSSKSISLV